MSDVFAYKCRQCGASKTLNHFDYYVPCDHCGATICLDTEGYMRSDLYKRALAGSLDVSLNPPRALVRAMEEQGRLYTMMEQAIKQNKPDDYRKYAEEYWRLCYMMSPIGTSFIDADGTMSDQERFDQAVRYMVDFSELTNFHPAIAKAYQKMNAMTSNVPSEPSGKSLGYALDCIEATQQYYEEFYKVHVPEKYGLKSESLEDMMRSAMAAAVSGYLQDWITWLSPEQKQELAVKFADLDPTIKAKAAMPDAFEDSGKVYQFENNVKCPRCGMDATKAVGCPILVCMTCGYYQDDRSDVETGAGKVTISCGGCGSPVEFADTEGVYPCPYCGSAYRYLKGGLAINRQYMEQFGDSMGDEPVRGLWEDPDTLQMIGDFFNPLWELVQKEKISDAELVYWLNQNYSRGKRVEVALYVADRIERWGRIHEDAFKNLTLLRAMIEPTGWFGHEDQWSRFIHWDQYPPTDIYGRIGKLMPIPDSRFENLDRLLEVIRQMVIASEKPDADEET